MLKVQSLFTEYAGEHGAVVKAAQDVSFEVPEGKLFTLLGPSGCGKTTTLRSIAGLERPTAGEIEVGGRTVYSASRGIFIAPNKRNFGMVVLRDLAAHERVPERRLPAGGAQACAEGDPQVMRVLAAVQLEHLVDPRQPNSRAPAAAARARPRAGDGAAARCSTAVQPRRQAATACARAQAAPATSISPPSTSPMTRARRSRSRTRSR